jgi:hypothetical protein
MTKIQADTPRWRIEDGKQMEWPCCLYHARNAAHVSLRHQHRTGEAIPEPKAKPSAWVHYRSPVPLSVGCHLSREWQDDVLVQVLPYRGLARALICHNASPLGTWPAAPLSSFTFPTVDNSTLPNAAK